MKETKISSFQDLHEIRRGHWSDHFVYRGEKSTAYQLRPKFGRRLVDPHTTEKGLVFPTPIHEQALLFKFKRRATPFMDKYPSDDWDWLAVAQHHGLATRLLDWTENILVALYFACDCTSGADAVIHVLNTQELAGADLGNSPFELKENVIFHPRHSTPRISAQAGLFTVHADPAQLFDGPIVERIVIPNEILVELETTLSTYGISKSSLFPGLDSLAEEVNGRFACS